MSGLAIAAIAALAAMLLGELAFRWRARPPAPPPPAPTVPSLSAAELRERLARLARESPPANPHPMAMCYSVATPPQLPSADYLCPLDGSRTQYAAATGMAELVRSLPTLRRLASELPGLSATLDERQLCRQCTPQGQGGVALKVTHPDGRLVRTEPVGALDLQLLGEFLAGGLEHSGGFGEKTPLKDHLPRLRELLGIPEETS